MDRAQPKASGQTTASLQHLLTAAAVPKNSPFCPGIHRMLRCTVWNEKHAFSVGDVKTHQTLRNLLGEGKGKGKGKRRLEGNGKGKENEKRMQGKGKGKGKKNKKGMQDKGNEKVKESKRIEKGEGKGK